jgi:hypothetical protein
VDDKDASLFPVAIPNPSGHPELAMLHRPLFPGTRPEETACHPASRDVDLDRESIWISYCPMASEGHEPDHLGRFTSHHRLATPVSPWERLKIGGGTPPILTRHGWSENPSDAGSGEKVGVVAGRPQPSRGDLKSRKRLPDGQYGPGPNEIEEKKTNPFLKFLTYFWGPIPWMIEAAVILSGVSGTGRIFSSSSFCFFQRRGRILGRTPGGQRHRRLKAKLAIKAKVKRDGKWTDPAAREVVPGDVIRLRWATLCRRMRACWRAIPDGGGSVRVDRRILARHAQTRRGGVFRLDYPPGRNRRDGLRHRRRTPTSARPRNWCRRRTPSAISSAPC